MHEHVVPAIQQLWSRARFREAASWSQRVFAPGADTPQWRLVKECAEALRQSAKDVLAVAKIAAKYDVNFPTPDTAKAILDKAFSPGVSRRGKAIIANQRDGTGGTARSPLRADSSVDVALAVLQAGRVARRVAKELVNINDYFGPAADGATVINGQSATVASFNPYFNLRLGYVGNQIVRSLLTRVGNDRDALDRVRRAAYSRLKQQGRSRLILERERQSWQQLEEVIGLAEQQLLTCSEARLTDSCAVLVQVFLDWSRPAPDTSWLGLPDWMIARKRGILRHRLNGGIDYNTAERIARALSDVSRLYQGEPPYESEKEEAIVAGHLVLVEQTQEAFWQNKKIIVDWKRYPSAWQMFWQLASRGRSGRAVQQEDLYPDKPIKTSSTMHNRWRRLKTLLPATVSRLVRPGQERSSYLLDLERSRIYLLGAERTTLAAVR
jgi:hypothetical protein